MVSALRVANITATKPAVDGLRRVGLDPLAVRRSPAVEVGEVSDAWEQHALEWLTWARTPDLDVYYGHMNLPAFAKARRTAGQANT
jgi:hypothetical protein